MGFLDNTGLAKLWLKITSKLSGKVDTTTTVNGHPLSSNVAVTQQDIGIKYSSTEPSNPSNGDIWLQPESESNIIHDTDIASSAITGKNTVNAALTQLNSNFGGATSSAGGSKGLVPAPSAGDQHKFLCADGDWENAPGSQTYVETVGPLTPTNGVLNQDFAISYVMAEMKAIQVEPSDASVFMDTLTVTMSEGNINVSCPNMTGTCQSMAITFVLRSSAQGETITSSEFNLLSTRIGNLGDLTTTANTSTVAAINEVKSGVNALNDQIGNLETSLTPIYNAPYCKSGKVVTVFYRVNIQTQGAKVVDFITGLPTPLIQNTNQLFPIRANHIFDFYDGLATLKTNGNVDIEIFDSNGLLSGVTCTTTISLTYIAQ